MFLEGRDSERQQPGLKQRLENLECRTEFVAETMLPTRHGIFRLRGYRHTVRQPDQGQAEFDAQVDNWRTFTEPTAIIKGEIEGSSNVVMT